MKARITIHVFIICGILSVIYNNYYSVDFRTHFKALSPESLSLLQTSLPVQSIRWAQVRCSFCELHYTSLLQRVLQVYPPLSQLLQDFNQAYSERTLTTCNQSGIKNITNLVGNSVHPILLSLNPSSSEIKDAFYISIIFIHALQTLLKRYRRLVHHPERCSPLLVQNCSIELSPTQSLLCV